MTVTGATDITLPVTGALATVSQVDAMLPLAGGTVTGSVLVDGNTTLGDASGDSVTINAGTVTAANATDVSSNRLANVGALDDRYLGIPSSSRATVIPLSDLTVTSGSGGGVLRSGGAMALQIDATNSSYATAESNYLCPINADSTGNHGFSFSDPFTVIFQMKGSFPSSTTNSALRVIVGGETGGVQGPTTMDPPNYKSLGLEFVVGSTSIYQLRLFTHDGTTLTYGSTTVLTDLSLGDGAMTVIISGNGTTLKCRFIASNGKTRDVGTLTYSAITGVIIPKVIFALINDGTGSDVSNANFFGSLITYPVDLIK